MKRPRLLHFSFVTQYVVSGITEFFWLMVFLAEEQGCWWTPACGESPGLHVWNKLCSACCSSHCANIVHWVTRNKLALASRWQMPLKCSSFKWLMAMDICCLVLSPNSKLQFPNSNSFILDDKVICEHSALKLCLALWASAVLEIMSCVWEAGSSAHTAASWPVLFSA